MTDPKTEPVEEAPEDENPEPTNDTIDEPGDQLEVEVSEDGNKVTVSTEGEE